MKHIYIGTSGYNYKSWKGNFYPSNIPQSKWLEYYSTQFQTVEINATFYRQFPKSTFEKWKKTVSSDFQFAIKGSRFITHIKKLHDINDSLSLLLENASGLEEKLGPILWQFPASFHNTEENEEKLSRFLEKIPPKFLSVVELRDDSWFHKNTYNMLNHYKTGFVINDTLAFDTTEAVTDSTTYIRFHGPASLYSSSYSDAQLEKWSEKIKTYQKRSDVYCYFNNDVHGYAPENARTLSTFLNDSSQ